MTPDEFIKKDLYYSPEEWLIKMQEYADHQTSCLGKEIERLKCENIMLEYDLNEAEMFAHEYETQIRRPLENRIEELKHTLQSLMISMSAHPDCAEGSEFDDLTNIAQEIIDKTT